MAKLLYILSNPNPQGFSSRLGQTFLDAYQDTHPQDDIEVLNLYEIDIPFYDAVDISAEFVKKREHLDDDEQAKTDLKNMFADQLLSADKIVIVSPMWNFGVPAILKAYIDMIVLAGKTFSYEGGNPTGLLTTQKAMFIAARGGDYSKMPEYEFQNNYLKTLFGWLGVKELFELIHEGSMMPDSEERFSKLEEEAKKMAVEF